MHHRFRNVASTFSGDIGLQLLRDLPTIGANFSAMQKSRRDFIPTTVADTGIATRFARRCCTVAPFIKRDRQQTTCPALGVLATVPSAVRASSARNAGHFLSRPRMEKSRRLHLVLSPIKAFAPTASFWQNQRLVAIVTCAYD